MFQISRRKKKLHLSLIHTSSSQSLNRERKVSGSEKILGRIIIFRVIMFTISKGFAVIYANKNLKLPLIEDILASGRTRFLEWVVSENQVFYRVNLEPTNNGRRYESTDVESKDDGLKKQLLSFLQNNHDQVFVSGVA
ncbi:unnamed protein product [Prunus armeniaca]